MGDNEDAQQAGMVNNLYEVIPKTFKDLRACLRCSLIKDYEKFYERGCENCTFLAMQENPQRVMECTTSYFEGRVRSALIHLPNLPVHYATRHNSAHRARQLGGQVAAHR